MTWSSDGGPRHGRPNAPHPFRAEQDSEECLSCGASPQFRAHQPLWWRFFHPLATWR